MKSVFTPAEIEAEIEGSKPRVLSKIRECEAKVSALNAAEALIAWSRDHDACDWEYVDSQD